MATKPMGTLFTVVDLDLTKVEEKLQALHTRLVAGATKSEEAFRTLGISSDRMFNAQKTVALAAYDAIRLKATSTYADMTRAQASYIAKTNALNQQMASPGFAALGIRSSASIISEMQSVQEFYRLETVAAKGNARDIEAIEAAKTAKITALSNEYNAVQIANDAKRAASAKLTADAQIAAQSKTRAQGLMQIDAYKEDVARTKAAQDQKIKDANAHYDTLGMKSTAYYNEQIASVKNAASSQQAIVGKSSEEWTRIEKQKNAKIKELNKEMVGEHEMSMASMTRAVLRFYAAYYVVSTAVQMLGQFFMSGIQAIDSLKVSTIAVAAQITSMQGPENVAQNYRDAVVYANALNLKLMEVDANSFANFEQIQLMNRAMINQGVILDINNAKQVEGFTALTNAVNLFTTGQDKAKQASQEMRAVAKQMDALIKQQGVFKGGLKDFVTHWKKVGEETGNSGIILEKMEPFLIGIIAASGDIQKTWEAVSSSLQTNYNNILRIAFEDIYKELIESGQRLIAWLKANKDEVVSVLKFWINAFAMFAKGLWEVAKALYYFHEPLKLLAYALISYGIASGITALLGLFAKLSSSFLLTATGAYGLTVEVTLLNGVMNILNSTMMKFLIVGTAVYGLVELIDFGLANATDQMKKWNESGFAMKGIIAVFQGIGIASLYASGAIYKAISAYYSLQAATTRSGGLKDAYKAEAEAWKSMGEQDWTQAKGMSNQGMIDAAAREKSAAANVKTPKITGKGDTSDAFKALGIRSTEEIQREIKEVEAAYEEIVKSGKSSSQDLINIERAKNAKIKELNDEMLGIKKGGAKQERSILNETLKQYDKIYKEIEVSAKAAYETAASEADYAAVLQIRAGENVLTAEWEAISKKQSLRSQYENTLVQAREAQYAVEKMAIEDSVMVAKLKNEKLKTLESDLLLDIKKIKVEAAKDQLKLAQEQATKEYEIWKTTFQGGIVTGYRSVMSEYENIGAQTESMTKNAFKSMGDALAEFVKTGKLDFSSLAQSIIADMIKIYVQQQMLGMMKGAGSVDWMGLLIKGFTAISGAVGGDYGTDMYAGDLRHSGGIVGSDYATSRALPISTWDSAARFHSGLAPDEFPSILQRGEGVFTKNQMKAMGGGSKEGGSSKPETTNNNFFINAVDSKSFEDMCRRNPGAIVAPVMNSLRDNKTRTDMKSMLK
jgi:hypothetical protein